MIIPSKFSGFHNGVRRCFGGGGGGGGGGDGGGDGGGPGGDAGGGPNDVYTPPTNTNVTNTGVNTNRGNVTGMNFTGSNTGGYSGSGINTTQGMATLGAAKGTPWGQSGAYYNDLLNQGFSSDQIRNSASSMYGAPSDANWGAMVQNAGMTSPTGRPMAGSDQFFQPVYNPQYQNYARPVTQFNVSSYGTQPSNSPAFNSGMSRGAINNKINDFYNTNYRDNPMGVSMSDTLNFMREQGINRDDFQMAGGVNNYGPQMSMPSMQTQAQQPFNPYSNNSGFNGQLMTAGYGGFGSPMGGLSPFVTNSMYQMQSPFSYQQQYNPYQMQSPFSYQQPTPQRTSSGPSQAIVGRSSQMRGTPNVMRRAEGGIASLVDDVE
jgi:hypothetical protein